MTAGLIISLRKYYNITDVKTEKTKELCGVKTT